MRLSTCRPLILLLLLYCSLLVLLDQATISETFLISAAASFSILFICSTLLIYSAGSQEGSDLAGPDICRVLSSEIQKQQRLIDELTREKELAAAGNRTKSAFLSNMSHEIRTQTHSMTGMLELLLDSSLTGTQREYVDTLRFSTDSLLTIINDVIDLTRIENGRLQVELRSFHLKEYVQRSVELVEHEADQKHVTLVFNIDPRVPEWLVGDPVRLQQVLLNLLNNAIKFAFVGGGVVVQVLPEQVSARDAVLRFVVSDTGVGVPLDIQDKIFELFSQPDGAGSLRYGGTGLGLTVAAQLVKLLKGRIWLRSIPYRGSAFHVELSFERAAVGESVADRNAVSQGVGSARPEVNTGQVEMPKEQLKILLVEDHVVSQMVMVRLLENLGYSVDVANTGVQAVKKVTENKFDLVLMDIQMPELDGYGAAAQIREQERGGSQRLPIVALTANAMRNCAEQCYQAGMDDYVTKPVRRSDLCAVIERNIRQSHLGITTRE